MTGLVLSGGGARCFAQLGALRALEERGIHPSAIAACSSAAIIGALIAAGYDARTLYRLARRTDFGDMTAVQFGSGLLSSDQIGTWLARRVPEQFEQLRIPLALVAVDIQEGTLHTYRSGALIPAALASNAFPGVFEPVKHDNRTLMDGGILNVVPLDVIRELSSDPVIVVDVASTPARKVNLDRKTGLLAMITRTAHKEMPLPIELMYKAYVITRGAIVEDLYRQFPPDLTIRPPLDQHGIHDADFGSLDEAVDLGYNEANSVLDAHSEQLGKFRSPSLR
ncbi:patatin-like phospholipase family protein [Deinococcus peraridilitoris]|uniref:Putative esterase of the alpha-beta hydrolase superfamily n=1 Tax=Deinococcus peraridilitoris (strain DSM 19664 / LMG 22246 / CIP 109416 / KR-200) TaxID=937777 RepID=L0A7Y8_DEIPD|nr:patatin-like phospholipase family protein [Deinococcus peraridilitoris]AFZ69549.1 putative esterase of the alpha-beta hydrolase superfamily [Deinococcus peraridilitoris DSM 19664]